MGDMAEDILSKIESGDVVVLNLVTKKAKIIENITMAYSSQFDDEKKYKVLCDYYGQKISLPDGFSWHKD